MRKLFENYDGEVANQFVIMFFWCGLLFPVFLGLFLMDLSLSTYETLMNS